MPLLAPLSWPYNSAYLYYSKSRRTLGTTYSLPKNNEPTAHQPSRSLRNIAAHACKRIKRAPKILIFTMFNITRFQRHLGGPSGTLRSPLRGVAFGSWCGAVSWSAVRGALRAPRASRLFPAPVHSVVRHFAERAHNVSSRTLLSCPALLIGIAWTFRGHCELRQR